MKTQAERQRDQMILAVKAEREKREELEQKLAKKAISDRDKKSLVTAIIKAIEQQNRGKEKLRYFGNDPVNGVADLGDVDFKELKLSLDDIVNVKGIYLTTVDKVIS